MKNQNFIEEVKTRFKKVLHNYFYEDGVENLISKIEVKYSDTLIELILTSNRPGLLIGKGGVEIDKLSDVLNNMCDISIKISIEENTYWRIEPDGIPIINLLKFKNK